MIQVFADIMDNFASVCELLGVQPGNFTHFYPDLKVSKESQYGWKLRRFLRPIQVRKQCPAVYILSEARNCEVPSFAYFPRNSVFASHA